MEPAQRYSQLIPGFAGPWMGNVGVRTQRRARSTGLERRRSDGTQENRGPLSAGGSGIVVKTSFLNRFMSRLNQRKIAQPGVDVLALLTQKGAYPSCMMATCY